jgi:predicted small lipoprotein YifL
MRRSVLRTAIAMTLVATLAGCGSGQGTAAEPLEI